MADTSLNFRANCSSGVPVLALGALALAAGIYHNSAGALALGVTLLVGPALVFLALRRSLRGLAVRRLAPTAVFEGDTVEVRIRLENRSRFPVFFPRVSEIFAPEIHQQKEVLFPDRIPSGETVERSYEGVCLLPRGCYSFGPTAVSISDPFGWFQLRKHLEGRRPIKVYPRIQEFGVSERIGGSATQLITPRIRFGIGESQEFFSVREYQRGDALRRIHWRLTAHRGIPVVREFARVATGDLSIFVDNYRKGLIGVGRSSSLEHGIKIAAALSARALRRGHRVKFVSGMDPASHLPFGREGHHLQRLLDILVHVRPSDSAPLPAVLARHSDGIESGSTVVVQLAPYLDGDTELEGLLSRWRSRGVRVLAVIFDSDTFRYLWESRIMEGSSRTWANRLRSRGLETFLVPCAADLRVIFGSPRRGGAT